jgi:hypothetical protein
VLRILLTALGLLAASAAAAVPPGIPLWERARTGMTTEQVLNAFPDAARRDPDEQSSRAEARRLGAEKARIPRMRIQGDPYRARFLFRDGGLIRVVLEMIHGEMPFSQGLRLTGRVREALTDQYGPPADKNATSDGYRVDWRDGRRRIRLVVISRSYEVKAFQIVYEPADSAFATEQDPK